MWFCFTMLEMSIEAFPLLVTDEATVFREEAPV
jgi:hypothetical protein